MTDYMQPAEPAPQPKRRRKGVTALVLLLMVGLGVGVGVPVGMALRDDEVNAAEAATEKAKAETLAAQKETEEAETQIADIQSDLDSATQAVDSCKEAAELADRTIDTLFEIVTYALDDNFFAMDAGIDDLEDITDEGAVSTMLKECAKGASSTPASWGAAWRG